MSVVATEAPRISNLVKYEDDLGRKGVTREEVVVNVAAETTLTLGSVLGQVTASGKYVPRNPAGVDGSEASAAVMLFGAGDNGIYDQTSVTIPATTDTTVIVLKPATGSYAVVADEALVFDVAHSAGERTTAVEELNAIGIQSRTQA